MPGKTVLILGGGVGGMVTANALRQQLSPTHRVVMVERQAEHIFSPSLLWVMVGWRQPKQITRDLRRLLRPGVEVMQNEAQEIDPERQRVKVNGSQLAYDYLVVALGADLAPQLMPGFGDGAHTAYDLEGATRLWSALQSFEGGRVAILVSALPYKCPAAPYETALLIEDYLRRRGVREQCELDVYTPETLPMGVAGPAMGRAVVGMLEARDIRFHPELNLTHIQADRKELVFSNHAPAPFDLLAGVPPHQSPRVVKESPLANEAGWVPVDKRTLQTRYENVYAIGDVTLVSLPNGKALPKAGVFADGQGHTVAQRIAGEIQGAGARAEFDGFGFCWIETGDGSAGFASGQFYAEPDPVVPLPRMGRKWHWGKVLFEKYWLGTGFSRGVSRLGLQLAGRALGIPASL